MGYHMAGFDIVGIDVKPQPHYPFRFYQMDVTRINRRIARRIAARYDAIHASPPCQFRSYATRPEHRDDHPNLIPSTRRMLDYIGLPYVIENVENARSELLDPVRLCGSSFGLRVRRHRFFECSFRARELPCRHEWQDAHQPYIVYRSHHNRSDEPTGVVQVTGGGQMAGGNGYFLSSVAMGIDWMNRKELNQAIPPAYTMFLGKQMIKEVEW